MKQIPTTLDSGGRERDQPVRHVRLHSGFDGPTIHLDLIDGLRSPERGTQTFTFALTLRQIFNERRGRLHCTAAKNPPDA